MADRRPQTSQVRRATPALRASALIFGSESVSDSSRKCGQRFISPSGMVGAPADAADAIGPDMADRYRSPHPRSETEAGPKPKFKDNLSLQPLDPVPVE